MVSVIVGGVNSSCLAYAKNERESMNKSDSPPNHKVRVWVKTEEGQAIEGAGVEVVSSDTPVIDMAYLSDSDGGAMLLLPAGEFEIGASLGDDMSGKATVTVPQEKEVTIVATDDGEEGPSK